MNLKSSHWWEGPYKGFGFMELNATFNNISVISWWSILLVEGTGENNRPVASHWQTLSHNVILSTPCHEWGSNSTTLVVIGTDCTGSCKSNDHRIMTTTASGLIRGLLLYWYRKIKEYPLIASLFSNKLININ